MVMMKMKTMNNMEKLTLENIDQLHVGDILTTSITSGDHNADVVVTNFVITSTSGFGKMVSELHNDGTIDNQKVLMVDDMNYYIVPSKKQRVKLYLNQDGVNATGKDSKLIDIKKCDDIHISLDMINLVFPKSLIDHFECIGGICMSDVHEGDLLEYQCAGSKYVSQVVRVTPTKFIVKPIFDVSINEFISGEWVSFNFEGIPTNKEYRSCGAYVAPLLDGELKNAYQDAMATKELYRSVLMSLGVDVDLYHLSYDVCDPIRPDNITLDMLKRIQDIIEN